MKIKYKIIFKYLTFRKITKLYKEHFELDRYIYIPKFKFSYKTYKIKWYRFGNLVIQYNFADRELDKLTKLTLNNIYKWIKNDKSNIVKVRSCLKTLYFFENRLDNIEIIDYPEIENFFSEYNLVEDFIDNVWLKIKDQDIKYNLKDYYKTQNIEVK